MSVMTNDIGSQQRSAEDWANWADDFASRLAERAQAAEAARTLPDETIAEAHAAAFFNILAPTGVGGHGIAFSAFLDIVRRLSVGCTSSGWSCPP